MKTPALYIIALLLTTLMTTVDYWWETDIVLWRSVVTNLIGSIFAAYLLLQTWTYLKAQP